MVSWKQANLYYNPNIQRAVDRLQVAPLSPDLHWHVAPKILYCVFKGKPLSRLGFRSRSRCRFPNGFVWAPPAGRPGSTLYTNRAEAFGASSVPFSIHALLWSTLSATCSKGTCRGHLHYHASPPYPTTPSRIQCGRHSCRLTSTPLRPSMPPLRNRPSKHVSNWFINGILR